MWMLTAGSSAESLRAIHYRLGLLRAQRSMLAIVVSEQASAHAVVPRGDGQWNSPAKSAYLVALSELRAGMNLVSTEASAALVAVNIAIERAEDEERVAALVAAGALEPSSPQQPIWVPRE